jgi:hypothetical protein
MSFALTTRQVRRRHKTVTRRNGWRFARVGMIVQPVIKSQGIPKGGHVRKIGGPIRFVSVTREPLGSITAGDVAREGFPHMTRLEFVELYTRANGGNARQIVTRIEFEYVDAKRNRRAA